jgi:hypothetical protein
MPPKKIPPPQPEVSATDIPTIKDKLGTCFEPEDVKWLPGSVSKDGSKALAFAYADPRAYMDRLNDVVGPENWSKEFRTSVSEAKIFVTCRVTIKDLGFSEDVGEANLTDDNAYTVAASQAFKRACVQYGMGRYFYDLPKVWCDYDKAIKHLKTTPELPEWAIPTYICEMTGQKITATNINNRTYSAQEIVRISRSRYGKILSIEAMSQLAKEAKERAGKTEPTEQVTSEAA